MAKSLTEPHVLLASGNANKMLRNLEGILNDAEISKIRAAVDSEALGLYKLGIEHFEFAEKIDKKYWRQRVSRLYYGAYNVKRAIQLCDNGAYSTDSSDHQRIDDLPKSLNNFETYKGKLKNIRDDRNLADYSHTAMEGDLLVRADDIEVLVRNFIADSKQYLNDRGIVV